MAAIAVIDINSLRAIRPDEVKVGMHLFSIERWPSGGTISYDGIVEKIERQSNGLRVAHLEGIPRQYRGLPPEGWAYELYEVVTE